MPRRYPVQKAPPKPEQSPCPHCDGAYWRYNGTDWYACDRATKKRHVCTTPSAVEERRREEAERQQRLAAARRAQIRQERTARRWRIGLYLVGAVVAVALAFGWYTSRPVYHGPPGGTAECNDGTISYAKHHQGACSWHGGVHAWNR
jgi:Protein of unknown function (DUF3761)